MNKPKDPSIIAVEECESSHGPGTETEPGVSMIVAANKMDYEIIITSRELRHMLYECDPDWREREEDEE